MDFPWYFEAVESFVADEMKILSYVQQRNTGLCVHCSSLETQMVRMT